MNFFDALLKTPGRALARALLNSEKTMSLINARLSDFLHVHSLVCREGMSLMICFSVNGMDQEITITVGDYDVADDGSWIRLNQAGSTVPGIDHHAVRRITDLRTEFFTGDAFRWLSCLQSQRCMPE